MSDIRKAEMFYTFPNDVGMQSRSMIASRRQWLSCKSSFRMLSKFDSTKPKKCNGIKTGITAKFTTCECVKASNTISKHCGFSFSEFQNARDWVVESLDFDKDYDASAFEKTIRLHYKGCWRFA